MTIVSGKWSPQPWLFVVQHKVDSFESCVCRVTTKHIYYKLTKNKSSKKYWNKAPALLAAVTGLPGSEEMVVVDLVEEVVGAATLCLRGGG